MNTGLDISRDVRTRKVIGKSRQILIGIQGFWHRLAKGDKLLPVR